MVSPGRLIAAGVLAVLSYFLAKPVMEAVLAAIRRRIGKGFQCVALARICSVARLLQLS